MNILITKEMTELIRILAITMKKNALIAKIAIAMTTNAIAIAKHATAMNQRSLTSLVAVNTRN
jgi:molybdenum cofactor biosynthesis enzyme MoaA